MIKRYQQLIKIISEQLKRSGMYNAKGIAENVAEEVQSKFTNAQNIATKQYNIVAKKLNNQVIMIQDLNIKALESNIPLSGKIVKWWQRYNQLIGLDTVEAARRQMIALQNKLFECQDNRRTLNKELTDITYKLQDIYAELVQTKRDDPKYVQLTIVEHKYLQEQKKVINQQMLSEKEERDNFTQLATAIKEYHDSQNLHAQKYKYLSFFASAVLAIASLIGSMMLNNKRILDVRNTIQTAQEKNELLLQANTNELSDIKKTLHSLNITFSQQLANIKKEQENKENSNKSSTSNIAPNIIPNIFMTSAKYSANLLISGLNYFKRGIYASG
ncbi:coiled-coil domain-containing protein 51-like isoform X1 [Pogonomyrmex barbatus]|uniref:Coiled-coil domain-containing protein 51-like isoform X1 n=1 Tax=Pogonomyrmex barbatus TaxID=144034 RepID=A0A6I9WG23_9HYME|nr:coiled-coil domain-containing protein 51-like isoform X1 [Pogonomyrmex barbatus]